MNNALRSIIAAVFLLGSMMTSAANAPKKPLLLKPTHDQVDSILCILDDVIAHKADYRTRRIARTDSLIKAASQKHGIKRIDALKDAYANCSHVSSKKSFEILDRLSKLPEYKTDKNLRLWVSDSRAYIYSVIGMYHRSYALLAKTNVDGYDRPVRMHHYETVETVLNWIGTTFSIDGAVTPDEDKLIREYSDSLLTSTSRDPISMTFTDVEHDFYKHAYDTAIKRLVNLYPKTSGQNETYVYAVLSDAFTRKGDIQGATYYTAVTSIRDIQAGTTEYMCLPILAQSLFEQGDVDRAYNYLKCCIEDAHVYPAQFLINQATNLFPMIDKAYQQKKTEYETSRRNNMILIFCAVLLTFIIVSLLWYLRNRQKLMRKLERANETKDIFLKNITHEEHTPLNAIYGFAQILADESIPLEEESTREMANAICDGSKQLAKILDNIVEVTDKLSKLEKLEDVASVLETNKQEK